MIPVDPADDQDATAPARTPSIPAQARSGSFVRPGAVAWGRAQLPGASSETVEQALAAVTKDPERMNELLDELSRARVWLPLPAGERPVVDGHAVALPTVTYLGAEFVPAFTSAVRLERWEGMAEGEVIPHIVVGAAELARLLPAGLGIALNPGAEASVPIYPEGVRHLAATETSADGTAVRVGHPPAEPVALLREVGAGLGDVAAVRQASRAWLCVPGQGEGLVISVTLDDPASPDAHEAVIGAIERAAAIVPRQAAFPIDVTFPGEAEPDQVDVWVAAHAAPFYIRG
jgi:hypothetical protein